MQLKPQKGASDIYFLRCSWLMSFGMYPHKGPFALDDDDKLDLTMSLSEQVQHSFMTMSSSI